MPTNHAYEQTLVADCVREMKKFKTSFLINFIGLSSGLACALFIYLWVNDELHFDKFHKYDSQLYPVMELSKENGMMMVHDGTQGLLANAMAKDLPEVERAVSVTNTPRFGKFDLITPDKTLKATPSFAGKDFFNMFSFPLLQGNPASVMNDRNAIVISNPIAKSLFGSSSEAVGKVSTMKCLNRNIKHLFQAFLIICRQTVR